MCFIYRDWNKQFFDDMETSDDGVKDEQFKQCKRTGRRGACIQADVMEDEKLQQIIKDIGVATVAEDGAEGTPKQGTNP